ncbi:MAG: WecB/TagA/CpsF family glycosyltransferase [Phormidesmis sp.]
MTHLKSDLVARRIQGSPEEGMPKDSLPPNAHKTANAKTVTATSMLLTPQDRLNKSVDGSANALAVSANVQSSVVNAPKIDLLGMDFDNFSKQELLSNLRKGVVFTPNVDHLMKLRRDPDFVSVYQKADFKVCDSQVLMYASKFLGKPLKAKLSGSDLFPWFCEYHKHNKNIEIFLLGGREGVAREAQKRINARTGREIVVGEYSPPYGFESDPEECRRIVELIEASSANVLVVCLGAPKQERWIATYRDQLPDIDIFMAVGAAVDFEAGCKPRAPKYVSELGLEWLYRLVCEPKRLWRRYLIEGMPFVGLVLAEKLKQMMPQKLGKRASKA